MTTRMADLDDLIRQAAKSQPQALQPDVCSALMLAHFDFIFHLALTFLGDAAEADDATQETFLQAGLHIEQYQCGTNLKSWLARIAVNVCRMQYRRKKARQRLEQVLQRLTLQSNGTPQPTPEEALLSSERQRQLRQAVDALDEKHRLPVLLRYVQGLSVAEIAQILDEKEGTIHSRLHYAHQKLRERLNDFAETAAGTAAAPKRGGAK